MVTFKNITLKKRGGGTRKQRVKVLASGKFKFVKNLIKSKSRSSKTKTKTKTRRKTMAKKKRRSRKMTIPLAPIAGLAAGLAWPIEAAVNGDLHLALRRLGLRYTGFDPETGAFDINALKDGVGPLIVGLLVHKFVGGSPLNLNRMLASANVPFIRI